MKREAGYTGFAAGLLLLAFVVVPPSAGGPVCGDGVVDPGETCDPPDPGSSAADRCRADCRFCGDGNFDFVFEGCDDGNNVSGDGCEGDCHVLTYVAKSGDDATGDGSEANPYLTIQRAFDQAGSFTKIIVGPGTYNECVTAAPPVAADRPVKILAESWLADQDNAATIVTGLGVCDAAQSFGTRKPVMRLESSGSRVEGFTLTGGGASGIRAAGNVVITNNVITDNSATIGGGVFLDLTTAGFGDIRAEISGNVVADNDSTGDGGGIFVSAASETGDVDIVIDSNRIEGNTISQSGNLHGGGLGVFTESQVGSEIRVAVTRNLIRDNSVTAGTEGYSGGAWVYAFGYGSETLDVTGNTFADNQAALDGGGLSAWISTEGTRGDGNPATADSDIRHTINVADNVFLDNVGANGGGMDLFVFAKNLKDDEKAQINAARNIVTGNTALGDGGFGGGGGGVLAALTSWRSATPETWIRLEDNSVRLNTTGISGGGVGLVIEADADPPGDTSVPLAAPAFAAGRIDLAGNLIADNDASAPDAAGGGVFAYLTAFVDATATLDVDRSTIGGNTSDFGAGGIHVETFTGFDEAPGVAEAAMSLTNSIVSSNDRRGVGGPVPGLEIGILAPDVFDGNTGKLELQFAYSDVFGHPRGDYDVWFPDPTGQDGNISADPMFDARWREGSCSRTLDAADPGLDFSLEPLPNGGRANMGHTGGTAQAMISFPDPNGDAVIDGVDILRLSVAFGASTGAPRYDATVDVNSDGVVNGLDLATLAGDFGTRCN